MILNLGCGHKVSEKMVNVDFVSDRKDVTAHNLLKPLPFTSETADIVYHSNVLEHFTRLDGRRFIEENYRVLKPGGYLRCVVPDLENVVREYLSVLDQCRKDGINEKYQWIIVELLDQLIRHKPGGEMAELLSRENGVEDYVVNRIGSIKGTDSYKGLRSNLSFRKIKRLFVSILSRCLGSSFKLGRFRKSGECHLWMYDEVSLTQLLKECGFSEITRMCAKSSQSELWKKNNLDLDVDGRPIDSNVLIFEAKKEV